MILCLVLALAVCATADPAISELSPSGYIYEIPTVQRTWANNARKMCEDIGGRLAVVDNQDEHDFMVDFIKKHTADATNYWIGIRHKAGGWLKNNPTLRDFDRWGEAQPDNKAEFRGRTISAGMHCVELIWDAWTWNDHRCGSVYGPDNGVICQRAPAKSEPSPNGYTYQMPRHPVTTPNQGKEICESVGDRLPIIENKAENEFLYNYLHKYAEWQMDTWLGFRRQAGRGNGWWQMNPSFWNYTNWRPRRPIGGPYYCSEMMYELGQWNNRHCRFTAKVNWNAIVCQSKERTGVEAGSGEDEGPTPTFPEVLAPVGIRCFGSHVEDTDKIESEELDCEKGDAVCYGSKCKAMCEANEDCQIYTVHVGGGGCFLHRSNTDCGPFEEPDGTKWISGYSKHGHPPALEVDDTADNKFFETTVKRIQQGCKQVCQMLSTLNDYNKQACKGFKEYDNGVCFLYTN